MRVTLLAVGRLKSGPERELCARYAERFGQIGRSLALDLASRELDESLAKRAADRKAEEERGIRALLPEGAVLIACDERGKHLSSRDFAGKLSGWRDAGRREAAVVIGGADGLADTLRAKADLVLAFGSLTMPHQLVRVIVLEQLYRAAAIISGHPYHRD